MLESCELVEVLWVVR